MSTGPVTIKDQAVDSASDSGRDQHGPSFLSKEGPAFFTKLPVREGQPLGSNLERLDLTTGSDNEW